MSETTDTARRRLTADATTMLGAMPAMGRVMLVASAPGVLHERIGEVSSVEVGDGTVTLTGEGHGATVQTGCIATVVVDRSGRMRDQVLPKLDFLDAGDRVMFSLVGMAGLAPFDAAVGPFETGATDAPAPAKRDEAAAGELEDDPGLAALEKVCAEGRPVAIALATPGLTQCWRGTIDQVRPMMGNANIIMRDFHLHLRAGAVGGWQVDADGGLQALAGDGQPLGLTLRPADG